MWGGMAGRTLAQSFQNNTTNADAQKITHDMEPEMVDPGNHEILCSRCPLKRNLRRSLGRSGLRLQKVKKI